MLEHYLIRGILIGLVFGVPAGAIGALTVQRTLRSGFAAGLATGLGSSAADLLYACVGVFGVTLVSDFLLAHQRVISLIGGGLICVLGIGIFCQKAAQTIEQSKPTRLSVCFLSSFSIAIANPATILSFLMAFAAFQITGTQTPGQGAQLICGILVGTVCWWSALAGLVSLFRRRVTAGIMQWLNRFLGLAMVAFGVFMLVRGMG